MHMEAMKKQPRVFQDHKKFEDVEALDLRMGQGRERLETWGYDQKGFYILPCYVIWLFSYTLGQVLT